VTGLVYNMLLTPEPLQTPTPPIRLPMGERRSIVNDESVPVMGAVNNSPYVVVGDVLKTRLFKSARPVPMVMAKAEWVDKQAHSAATIPADLMFI
jgi:hypothetical protein